MCQFVIRGLPYWLREIPDIVFRTNNEPYKVITVYLMTKTTNCACGKHQPCHDDLQTSTTNKWKDALQCTP